MVLIGCKPKGRHTEQHDMFFGIANELRDLKSEMKQFWPEAKGKMHVDGWREVTQVNGQNITIIEKSKPSIAASHQLYFINLGGYKKDEFEEFHYKMVIAATDMAKAISISKQSAFFKHTNFEGASSHVDDKYGVDVDDIYNVNEILNEATKTKYQINLSPASKLVNDELHLGYFKFDSL